MAEIVDFYSDIYNIQESFKYLRDYISLTVNPENFNIIDHSFTFIFIDSEGNLIYLLTCQYENGPIIEFDLTESNFNKLRNTVCLSSFLKMFRDNFYYSPEQYLSKNIFRDLIDYEKEKKYQLQRYKLMEDNQELNYKLYVRDLLKGGSLYDKLLKLMDKVPLI